MIKISVDEATAYDMLSILALKILNGSKEAERPHLWLSVELEQQIGHRHYQIVSSPEYEALFQANERVFERINAIKVLEEAGDATYIDQQNYQRYLCKKRLQKSFFSESKLTEVKLGYDSQKS